MITSGAPGARRSSRVGLSRIASWVMTATRSASPARSGASRRPSHNGAQLAQPLVRNASSVTGDPGPSDSITESPRRVVPLIGPAVSASSPPIGAGPGAGAGAPPARASSSAVRRRRMSAWLRSSATM